MHADKASDNKRITKNALFLSVRMLLVLLVSLYTSRVILEALGVEDFGIYNIVGGVVSLFAFVNGAMSKATQRYIAVELGKREEGDVKRIFSACMMIHIFIALIVFVLAETVGLYIVNHFLTIPEAKIVAANWVYQVSIFSCTIVVVNSPYNGAIVAHERMQVFAYISLLEVLLRLGVSFFIVFLAGNKLIIYALLLLVVEVTVRLSYTCYCRRKLRDIGFYVLWDKRLLRELSGFMGWTMFNNMSIIACNQGINVLLSFFFNPVVNAARAIAVQVQNAIIMFSSNFQTAVTPQIVKSYSMNEKEYFLKLIFSASRLSFFLLLLLAFPIFVHIDYILVLWLKEVPDYTADFTRLVILIALVNVLAEPLQAGVAASGVIKYFQMVSGILLIAILPVSALVFSFIRMPVIVFVIYLIMTVVVYAYKLYYAKRHLALPLKAYLLQVILKTGTVSACCAMAYIAYYRTLICETTTGFLMSFAASGLLVTVLIYTLGLNINERVKIVCYLKKLVISRVTSNNR